MAIRTIHTDKSNYQFLKGYGELVIKKDTDPMYLSLPRFTNGSSLVNGHDNFWTSSRANSNSDATRVYQGNFMIAEHVIGTDSADVIKGAKDLQMSWSGNIGSMGELFEGYVTGFRKNYVYLKWSGDFGEKFEGGKGNDTLWGYEGDDTLHGDEGHDVLYGGDGHDILKGGIGNDMLYTGRLWQDPDNSGSDELTGGAGADTFFLGNATKEDSEIVNGEEGLDWANLGFSLGGDVTNLLFTAVPVLKPFTIAKAVVPMLFDVLKATSNADDDYVEASVSGKGSATITDFDPTEDVVFIPLESVGSTIYLEEDSENGNLLQVFRDTGSTDLIATIQLSSEFDSLLGNDSFNTIENSWGQLLASNSLIMDSSGANFYGQSNLDIEPSDLENLGTNKFLVLGAYSGANYVGTIAGDYIYGTDFGDVLSGYENPSMYSSSGNDIIYGFDGDDEFLPGDGNDTIYGGEGSDTANYFNSTNGITINLSNQNVNNDGLGGKDILDSIENIIGSEYSDDITGDSSKNTLIGNAGDDVLNGESGLDTLEGGLGDDTLNGGLGTDTATYANSTSGITINNLAKWHALVEDDGLGGTDQLYDVENIIGSDYDDYIRKDGGDSSNSTLKGGKGDDELYGGKGSDSLDGGDDNDYLWGGTGMVRDTLVGGKGDDTLAGDDGDDILWGNDGEDTLNGGRGNDVLIGGNGNNYFEGGRGHDTLYGGSSLFDTASYWTSTKGIVINLSNQSVNNDGFGGKDELTSIENITGSHHADKITGDLASNTLIGNGGNDTLVGGAGFNFLNGGEGTNTVSYEDATGSVHSYLDVVSAGVSNYVTFKDTEYTGASQTLSSSVAIDRLANIQNVIGSEYDDILIGDAQANMFVGGDGNDTLHGGAGVDSLVGGNDADIFVFKAEDSSTDIIQDFNVTQGDSIQVDVEAYYNAFNDVSFDYTYSGTDLTLTFSGEDIAILENIASDDVASVFKQIELTGTFNTSGRENTVDILIGDANNNGIWAVGGKDYVYGSDGNDTLLGGRGNDVMLGGDGDDYLRGYENNDILIGGHGADTFAFRNYSANSGSDRILDFTSAEGDIIQIDQSEYGIGSLNDINFSNSTGELSINNNILATLENYDTFAVNNDVVLV